MDVGKFVVRIDKKVSGGLILMKMEVYDIKSFPAYIFKSVGKKSRPIELSDVDYHSHPIIYSNNHRVQLREELVWHYLWNSDYYSSVNVLGTPSQIVEFIEKIKEHLIKLSGVWEFLEEEIKRLPD